MHSCSGLQNKAPHHVTESSANDSRGQTDHAGMGEAQLFILDELLFLFSHF